VRIPRFDSPCRIKTNIAKRELTENALAAIARASACLYELVISRATLDVV
jgi:hypothetical protein